MLLRRVVGLKIIVTEEFKNRLRKDLRRAIDRIDASRGQIQFQLDRYVNELAKTDLNQASQLRGRLNEEREKLAEARSEMDSRLREVEGLQIGDEYERGTLEGWAEVNVGDNLFRKLGATEVIVKDGVVVEFREREDAAEHEDAVEEVID